MKGTDTTQIHWYRFIKDASEEEIVYPNDNINFTTSAINSTHTTTLLTITNATKSYTGYYWVKLTSGEDNNCKNISLTVTGMYCMCMQFVVYSLKLTCFYLYVELKYLQIMNLKGVVSYGLITIRSLV